jgi:dGTPase
LKHRTLYDIPGADYDLADEGPTLEAQVVDIADSLAYLNHDIDDGLTSGCITADDLMVSALWRRAVDDIKAARSSDNADMFKYQVVKQLIDVQAKDLLAATVERLRVKNFQSVAEVKASRDCINRFLMKNCIIIFAWKE